MTSSQPQFPESRWQGIHVLPLSPFPQGCPSRSQERGPGNGSREWAPGTQEGSCQQPRTPRPVEEAPGGHRWLAPRPPGGSGSPPRPCRAWGTSDHPRESYSHPHPHGRGARGAALRGSWDRVAFLQRNSPTQESNQGLRRRRWILYQLSDQGNGQLKVLPTSFAMKVVNAKL